MTFLDAQIGRILDALRATDLEKNTYIFLTSDHGLSVGHHGLMGKQNMYEDSLRAPIIVAGPGIAPGRRSEARVYIQDIVPTTIQLAGATMPSDMEFASLMPLLKGTTQVGRQRIYAAYFGFQRAVIDGQWKLIHYPVANTYRLFDLVSDPDEMRDLAAEPESAEHLIRLKRILAAEMSAHDDPLARGEQLLPDSPKQL